MGPAPAQAFEQHYTVQQVAELWGVSEATVRRLFEDAEGVLKISMPRVLKISARKHKPHVLLSIPASVLERIHGQHARGFQLGKGRR